MSIEKMLSHVYEIEGLMLVTRRLGDENTPDKSQVKLTLGHSLFYSFATLTFRLRVSPFFCQRGTEIGQIRRKRCRVDG